MQIDNMLSEGLQLLMLGMGTVFFILILLIACLSLMSSFMSPSENDAETAGIESSSVESKTKASIGVIAAIQAAIHCYRASPNR